MRELRICLVLEGCYPYVHGGVSTWMHQYITVMKEHEFVLWKYAKYAVVAVCVIGIGANSISVIPTGYTGVKSTGIVKTEK